MSSVISGFAAPTPYFGMAKDDPMRKVVTKYRSESEGHKNEVRRLELADRESPFHCHYDS